MRVGTGGNGVGVFAGVGVAGTGVAVEVGRASVAVAGALVASGATVGSSEVDPPPDDV